MADGDVPEYLAPYLSAAKRYGGGFGSLLWASPRTQALRFDALIRAVGSEAIRGRRVLDVGCGRADLLDHLRRRDVFPHEYIGIEGVAELADAAERKGYLNATIVRGDFVRQPSLLREAAADVVVISGSLNTMEAGPFYRSIKSAFDAAGEALAFNFLCSTELSAAAHLAWHRIADVRAFARTLSKNVTVWEDYLAGDATVAISR
jgi:hypothetical protein